MAKQIFPHQYIAIEGNIGAGKTTLCHQLAEQFDSRLILEQFTDNPFLPFFYDSPERYAFPVELFFMTERHKQLQELLSQHDLFQKGIIADYFFVKTLLFARNNLNDQEYRLFQRLFNILNASFPKPELLVYLHRPVEELLSNIKRRGRSYEQDISGDYLLNIQNAYFDYFKTNPQLPILILDVEDADWINEAEHYQRLLTEISLDYEPGIHRKRLVLP
ncbi:deoxynucleoside kinase [Flavilitoribacter nigricans]|uniref:Deoxynucleoside kinase n=1 Tax=Flavilitoribacter nigricans (strain ATCC 23147 / DSM 23189 / NBRC 102662 / NCIMB 1420 / SS-2) TaxID=1122177 RepID=A0A2D0NGM9_FLAN2|nr:deoxynucleoside kinase [Flavilitoribacter nigricans]PHN06913.1 deoxynucleoside kinase [Flavilitoribacter nigricans DSM 23189 = NBRC 102662]